MTPLERIARWVARLTGRVETDTAAGRGPVTHVVILDGTMSSLAAGQETNAGLTYKLLREEGRGAHLSLRYEAGLQWEDWRSGMKVVTGRGINQQIRRSYGFLASRYRPGDRIFLLGFSRGAYAVRSLSGIIDRVGLLRAEHATHRNIEAAYRHYQGEAESAAAVAFREAYCDPEARIEAIGIWDTVKSLGLTLPLLWRITEPAHAFHNHALGVCVKRGFHALALDETRTAYTPVMWVTPPGREGDVEQMWFRGNHGDIGGHLAGFTAARGLSNIPLVWVLSRMEASGLPLPEGWAARFPQDAHAPSTGPWRGWGKVFPLRRRRVVGRDVSEAVHESVGRELGPSIEA